jgi:hypothetical protein
VHVHVVEDFKRIPILVNLQCVTKGASTNNLTTIIKNFVAKFKWPLKLWYDHEGSMFQCKWCIHLSKHKNWGFHLAKTKYLFFCVPIFYVAHKINLVVSLYLSLHYDEDWGVVSKRLYMFSPILITTLNIILRDENWPSLWRPRVSKYCRILILD